MTTCPKKPDEIESAYHDLNGSTERSSIPEAKTIVNLVQTARTNQWRQPGSDDRLGSLVPSVTVYFTDGVETIPESVSRIVERHSLIEVERAHRFEDIDSITFVRSCDAATE